MFINLVFVYHLRFSHYSAVVISHLKTTNLETDLSLENMLCLQHLLPGEGGGPCLPQAAAINTHWFPCSPARHAALLPETQFGPPLYMSSINLIEWCHSPTGELRFMTNDQRGYGAPSLFTVCPESSGLKVEG